MHKFMLFTLRCVVGSFLLMIGIFVVGGMLQANSPPRVYEDPVMTRIKWCVQKQERILQPLDESGKAQVAWWCIRQQYRTN